MGTGEEGLGDRGARDRPLSAADILAIGLVVVVGAILPGTNDEAVRTGAVISMWSSLVLVIDLASRSRGYRGISRGTWSVVSILAGSAVFLASVSALSPALGLLRPVAAAFIAVLVAGAVVAFKRPRHR